MTNYNALFEQQLKDWPQAAENYQALKQVLIKDFKEGNSAFRLQCNPKRMVSTAANVSAATIQERPCFLCEKNRPEIQEGLPFEDLTILVNPFPVFEKHFTIAGPHIPQSIDGRWEQMLRLAEKMDDCVVFYNGPRCGASAPDHFHFQAGNKGAMPIEKLVNALSECQTKKQDPIQADKSSESDTERTEAPYAKKILEKGAALYQLHSIHRGAWAILGSDSAGIAELAKRLLNILRRKSATDSMEYLTKGAQMEVGALDAESGLNSRQKEIEATVRIGSNNDGVGVNSKQKGIEEGAAGIETGSTDSLHTRADAEPMMNVLCWKNGENFCLVIFPRKAHRPACYFKEDGEKRMISPASVEMAGLVIAARQEDFRQLSREEIVAIYKEVSWSDEEMEAVNRHIREPLLNVGIVTSDRIAFRFPVPYRNIFTQQVYEGKLEATLSQQGILFDNQEYTELEFEPVFAGDARFELSEVVIGIGFHWERKEVQQFEGRLKMVRDGDKLLAINRVPLESYLTSVISSEMSAKASAELLKAHAVISRSWLLAQVEGKTSRVSHAHEMVENETERIKWYDREDHSLFDVCADDHCQRYQGITKAGTPQVREAIQATRGLVLTAGGVVCDARFSKCCGGMMETFENCWENQPKTYLQGLSDTRPQTKIEGLTLEKGAVSWILGEPDAFCNTKDQRILEQVLNNYDQETCDFYRWKVSYTTEEISKLAFERSGIDFGTILDLIPVERGVSGRLIRLKVVGEKRTVVLGKELEIRRTFSPSHLYSSAFVVEKTDNGFLFHGAGWGHGVGLCQIGAAVMGEQGYDYKTILRHYYPTTELIHQYL